MRGKKMNACETCLSNSCKCRDCMGVDESKSCHESKRPRGVGWGGCCYDSDKKVCFSYIGVDIGRK